MAHDTETVMQNRDLAHRPPGVSAGADEPADMRQRFERGVERLNALSERGPHDAYADVPWDQSGFTVDPADTRLALFSFDPLARTSWYRSLEPIEQARLGLRRTADSLRTGWEFENLLQQGLLARAMRMGNADPAFRYIHFEVAEESHHSMMFYEFVRRYAPEAHGMPAVLRAAANPLVQASCRRHPALFYLLVLGGEVPVDHVQRLVLRQEAVHPLVERIMAIHVEEEARHVGFANLELRRLVPQMSAAGRRRLARLIPEVLGIMVRLMLHPSPALLRDYAVPRVELKAAYRHPDSQQFLADAVRRIRNLCRELELVTTESQRQWERNGIWDDDRRGRVAA